MENINESPPDTNNEFCSYSAVLTETNSIFGLDIFGLISADDMSEMIKIQ